MVGLLRKAGSEQNGMGNRSTGHSLLGVVEEVGQLCGFDTGPQIHIKLIVNKELRP